MFLDEIDIQDVQQKAANERAILQTKDSPRKAKFKRMNLDRRGNKTIKRFRDSGVTVRGNMWSHNPYGQRVVVKMNVVKNKDRKITSAMNGGKVSYGGSGANLSAHISYISRSGAGENEEKAVLFDKENDGIDGQEFFQRSRDDRHHFRMIISPENGHEIEDFKGYVRDIMERAEKDLGCELDWISAVHYDTDDIHAHVIIRGVRTLKQFRKEDREVDLVIDRQYISYGFRNRAQERASELLGERSIDEMQKAIEKEIDALRVTSLDRFIEKEMDHERKIDVRLYNNFGKSQHFEQSIKGRLNYLESTGLATQHPPGVFQMDEDYRETLYAIQNRNDIMRQLHSRFDEAEVQDIGIYSIKAGEGSQIEGFVREKGFTDEITDKKFLVIEDMDNALHYVPVGENLRADDVKKGSLIRIKPGDRSSGKADHNINLIARKNDGLYRAEHHMAYIEKEQTYIDPEGRQGYLDSHLKRLETLEKNDVVRRIEDGIYMVPEDVIKQGEEITRQINERENKRFYPLIDILSKDKLESLITAEKNTWLDKEIYKRSIDKPSLAVAGDRVEEAIKSRQEWLIERGYGFTQSNGEFGLRDYALRDLKNLELKVTGQRLADKFEVEFETNLVKEKTQYRYLGYVELESGYWAVVGSQHNTMQLAQIEGKPELDNENVFVEFDALKGGKYAMREVERQKAQEQQKSKDIDRDNDLEQ